MRRYIIGRIGQAVLVLWITYTVAFLLLNALPGDGIMIKFEDPDAGLSVEAIAAIRTYYNVDQPLLLQYVHGLLGQFSGDFGYSIETGAPVLDRISAALPETAKLAGLAFVLAIVIAVVIAFISSYRPFGRLRNIISSTPALLVSIPTFWLGIMLMQIFSFQLGWFPVIGGTEWQLIVLPVITLAIPVSAPLAQILIRTADDVALQPFITVVEAKGATPFWTLSRHVVRNSLLPTLTITGLLLAELIAGSVVTETVFGRNGIGRLTNQAVASLDLPVMQALVVLIATVFVTTNLIVDLLYPVIDPRQRVGSAGTGTRRPRRRGPLPPAQPTTSHTPVTERIPV